LEGKTQNKSLPLCIAFIREWHQINPVYSTAGGIMRYSESIKPISYLKAHTAEIIREVAEGNSPYAITRHGEARAVVQNIQDYE